MKLGASRVLDTMDGPDATVVCEVFGLGRVPVPASEDWFAVVEEFLNQLIQGRNYLISFIDREGAIRAEVVLHIHDQ